MTLNIDDGEFYIKDKEIPWKGTSLYNLYKKECLIILKCTG